MCNSSRHPSELQMAPRLRTSDLNRNILIIDAIWYQKYTRGSNFAATGKFLHKICKIKYAITLFHLFEPYSIADKVFRFLFFYLFVVFVYCVFIVLIICWV